MESTVLQKNSLVKDYDIVFAAGSVAEESHKKSSKVVLVNSVDYDDYKHIRKNPSRLIDEKYCIFLDVMLPYHPDFVILGEKSIDPSLYYRNIDKFFENLENRFRLKVVIAVHPKSNYKGDCFGGRSYYQYKTCELKLVSI